jgi:DNA topoisomerase-1
VKELEEKGIGRPSTYATILSTIVDRGYVDKKENRFQPTELGAIVTELLVQNFPEELDYEFTADMESSLDKIEEGEVNWVDMLKKYYDGFERRLTQAKKKMRNIKQEEVPTDIDCTKCGAKMVIRWGKNGQFLACSKYPDCKNTTPFRKDESGKIEVVKQEEVHENCPQCGGAMVVKSGKFGRFLACSSYPDCKYTKSMSIGMKCPNPGCTGDVTERRTGKGRVFYGCTRYPACTFASWDQPVAVPCPQCNAPFVTKKVTKRDGVTYVCTNKECQFKASEEVWNQTHPPPEKTAG